jgi:protein SCO1/2
VKRLAVIALLSLCCVGAVASGADAMIDRIGFDAQPGAALPMDVQLRESDGRTLRLRELFDSHKPGAMMFGYYHCKRLCNSAIDGLARAAATAGVGAARDAELVFVSINSAETPQDAAAKQAAYARVYPAAAQWHFMTGDEADLQRLTQAAGFRYAPDTQADGGDFVHAAGVLLITPQGRISRLIAGIAIDPTALRLGLVEAGRGSIGSAGERLLLLCSHYDPASGRYGLAVMRLVQALALAMLLAFSAFVWITHCRRQRA